MGISDDAVRLLRALSEPAMFVSAGGAIVVANRLARTALGLDSERPVAADLGDRIEGPRGPLLETLRLWARSTSPTPGSFAIRGAASTTIYNARGCVLIPWSDDEPATLFVRFGPRSELNPFLLLNQKITELNDEVGRRGLVEDALRRSEAALRERAREAEALNRAKDEFLATVSHELRTPLNAILGWSSLLRGRSLPPDVSKALEVVHRNAASQARLIDDILDVSRIITGKLGLEMKPVDLRTTVEEAAEVVRPSADAKNIALVLSLPSEACMLVGDPDRLRQVAWNLLSNAVKFTERHGSVGVEVARRDSRICLTVADTGLGIDPEFLPFVFDRFKQADGTTTRRAGGLGLGLAIVRHVVELHGGTVEVSSEGPGRGATFTVALPIRAVLPSHVTGRTSSPEREPRAPVKSSRSGSLQGVRVLVVDDEEDARELVDTLLRDAGAEVTTAASGDEALRVLRRTLPHVVVSDIGMPCEDGLSFMRRVRHLDPDAGGEVPSIALTAYTRLEDRSAAIAAGFAAHIRKPVEAAELVRAVATLAGRREADEA